MKSLKVMVSTALPSRAQAALQAQGKVATQLNKGIEAIKEDPGLLGDVVRAELTSPVNEPDEVVKSSITTAPENVMFMDTLAEKLHMTRFNIMELIVKGLLSGIIRPQ